MFCSFWQHFVPFCLVLITQLCAGSWSHSIRLNWSLSSVSQSLIDRSLTWQTCPITEWSHTSFVHIAQIRFGLYIWSLGLPCCHFAGGEIWWSVCWQHSQYPVYLYIVYSDSIVNIGCLYIVYYSDDVSIHNAETLEVVIHLVMNIKLYPLVHCNNKSTLNI